MPKETKPTPPADNNGGSPATEPAASCCPTDFDLSPCNIVKVNGTLQIKATEKDGFPAGSYEWSTSSDKVTLQNDKSSTVTVKAKDKPGSGKESETITVKRTANGCADVTKQVKITVAKITFSASAKQKYGYDDFDTPADSTDDHICVKRSDNTFVKVKIEGGAVGTDFDWACEPPAPCTAGAPDGSAEFDLELTGAAEDKKETTLHARSKCPSKESFASIKVHVYKEREVDVIVAKIDKTDAGSNLQYPTADYAAHAPTANAKLKEAVVKYNITNFDAANKATPVNLASGTASVTYDIANHGGADLTAIAAAMTGTGSKVRVAIVRDMKSLYYLKVKANIGDTEITVTSGNVFNTATTLQLDTGGKKEPVTIKSITGSKIELNAALTKDHDPNAPLEYSAGGWSTDPILIMEGSLSLDKVKWTILHEVGHRDKGLKLTDINDATDFMHYNQGWTDYRLRYCPRTIYRGGGTENQWETIPRT